MAKIPLRAYNREIEQLIDGNQSQTALEHCGHILDQYPRYLDTLRLMGKAYLELRQFDMAEEVFQKILSSVPDDFTANLGMSLLREKQTNLDGTIWHMERAYEAQPSNTAVQNELRRLYKQRDGIDSQRIRLTRGALVRMYIRGDLVPQAISEIQSILAEDPSRMDIKTLHAVANYKIGKKEDAFAICQEILKDFPYAYDANRILFENPSSSLKIEEAQTIQQRLRELDPYFEYTSPNQPDPSKVAEEEVQIEAVGGIGLKTATTTTTPGPSFTAFDVFSQGSQTPESREEGSPPATPIEKAEIPSWMEDLKTSSFEGIEESRNFGQMPDSMPANHLSDFDPGKSMTTDDSNSRNDSSQGDNFPSFGQSDDSQVPANPFLAIPGEPIPAAEPGDIPEWLKALASEPPAASSDAVTSPLRVPGETGVLQMGDENLDFLRDTPDQAPEPLKEETAPVEPQVSQIESISNLMPPSPFLTSNESTQPVPLEHETETAKPQGRELPDWLRSAAEPQAEEAVGSDFRQDLISEPPVAVAPKMEEIALENQYQAPEPESQVTAPVEQEEVPTPEIEQYLEQLRKDITPGDQPDWLKKENLGSDLQALFEEPEKTADLTSEPAVNDLDWMEKLKQEEVLPAQPPAPPISTPQPTASVPNVPDWLFTPEEVDGETAPIHSDTPVTHQPPPDWLAAARPDIFSRDFDLTGTDQPTTLPVEAEAAAPVESTSEPAAIDFSSMSSLTSEEPVSAEPEKSEFSLPDLDFLQSKPVDFMNAERAPLEDNLVEPARSPDSTEELNFTSVIPAESLPADLAAFLREEEVGETTNPLMEEPTPEFSLNVDIPGLPGREPEPLIQPDSVETPVVQEEISPAVVIPQIEETPASAVEFTAQAQTPAFDQNLEEILTAPQQVSEPEAQVDAAQLESMLPPELEAAPPVVDIAPEPVSAPESLEEEKAVEEFAQAEQKTIPVSPEVTELFTKKPPVIEPTIPIDLSGKQPPIKIEEVPAVEVEQPVVIEEPVSRKVAQAINAKEAAPEFVEQSAFAEAPAPKPTPVKEEKKPAQSQPRAKASRPAKPKTVHVVESPAPATSRKNAGSADLTRAREAVNHGDLQTALRRYIKLVNANKLLDNVSNDLKELVRKHPKNYLAWQTYGDARLRSNRIQEALDAYAKAADLLK